MTFSSKEKETIRQLLINACELQWCEEGYKNTKVDELCAMAGISKGSFYLFYDSKEKIFVDVLIKTQQRLISLVESVLGKNPTKENLADALKAVYREYVSIPFISDTESADFKIFLSKLPQEYLDKILNHTNFDIKAIIDSTDIKFKINERQGLSILALLFRNPPVEKQLPYDLFETVDFMIDSLVKDIFE
ncbi:TetR/AcrR family transcriptional regulator [Enterococcus gilvus]|uniref:TetR/AcrR family transcriptional regulator n=1 Tax=Enterococcus gilvus TaxID=160453 RepID=UPI0028D7E4A3|nr:TetR/AcrR family transcriptional regulator [Enterococcus gilvus]